MDKLITVIIPVYNMEPYLERCLDSVLSNTYRDIEVICVDDGSKDNSLEILRRYESADSRVVVIAKENGGVSSARNVGLDHMSGDYVTFVDADDFVHPQFFEIMHYAIIQSGADLVIAIPTKVFPQDLPIKMNTISVESLGMKITPRIQVYRNRELRSYCCCKLLKTSAICSCRFQLGFSISEDILFFAAIWENNPELLCCTISESMYYYYQGNPNSAIATSNEHEMLKATKYCIDRCAISRENEQIYLFMAIEQGIWHRYYGSTIRGDRTVRKVANPLLRKCWKRMIISKDYSPTEKIMLTTKIFMYPLYLLYRRRNPEYRKWERLERERVQDER